MKEDKITLALLWPRHDGRPFAWQDTILGLDSERFRTICICMMKNNKKPNFFEEKGIKTFYLSNKRYFRVLNLGVIYRLVRILKEEKVDIVHCHKHKSIVYGTIAAMIARTPVIIAHVLGLGRTRNWHRKLTNFFIMKRINKILTVGEAVRDDVLKHNPSISPEKVSSLGNSIDVKRYAEVTISKKQAREKENFPIGSFLFGNVGRLAPTKGQIYLIRAFSKVKHKLPSAHLVFVGDGPLKKELQEETKKAGLCDSVQFVGYRENVPELLKAMDAFVFSSIAEGMPGAILEALAAGVPCIASAVGGIPEIITNNETGFLVPPKNEEALTKAMLELTKMSEERRQKLIDIAKMRVYTHFSHELVIKRFTDIYETEVAHCYESNRSQKSDV